MHTVKQMDRLWLQGRYTQLFGDLTHGRMEAAFAGHLQSTHASTAAAAMVVIRLEELAQPHVKLHDQALRCLLGQQESDGGWGDPMLTSLCLRALLTNHGGGDAIERGLAYLANLQQDVGIWPRIPFRRLPGDSLTSVFVLTQLGHEPRFRDSVNFDAVTEWFSTHSDALDVQTKKLWQRVELRSCRWKTRAASGESRLVMLWT